LLKIIHMYLAAIDTGYHKAKEYDYEKVAHKKKFIFQYNYEVLWLLIHF